jgi:DNA-3-methyladenine glycosylase I
MEQGIVRHEDGVNRCFWTTSDPLYQRYHDTEWGRENHDDVRLFEKICLEGFQAGLSWLTILKKRENFRRAFAQFDVEKVARFNERSIARLMLDAGIVRHRGKIESAINNAKRSLEVIEDKGSLNDYFWEFVPPKNERPRRMTRAAVVQMTQSPTSVALSKDLKKRGFTFVGPTTAYAFMQSMGLVNDHIEGCDIRADC